MIRRASFAGVEWYAPRRKRPIARSTKAANDLIVILAAEGGTIQEIHDRINYDQEAKAVLQAYIDLGYGAQVARDWFR